ncbi:hypothetical protein [Paenibacillus piri]|uniref:Uncharacterized protein n=1 Tax=Paenibacillus piri TaxID=2547395 RepID=A0A4R5KGQ6_9BACL|nr:hypothetical protein [Paenibacillus piri]TDF94506.1 hypothetical protein E1757_24195 [Paenibacillus piri]
MKKSWNYVTAGTLLLSLTLGLTGGASAETAGDAAKVTETAPAASVQPATKVGAKPVVMYRTSIGGLMMNETHERNYLKLLVKTYTPESEADWLAAFEARKQAEANFPKATPSVTVSIKDDIIKLDKKEAAGEAAQGGTDSQTAEKIMTKLISKEIAEQGVVKSGEEGQAEGKTFAYRIDKAADGVPFKDLTILPLGEASSSGILKPAEAGQNQEVPPAVKRQADFTKAVEADDTKAIKELLPQLLEDYKSQTVQMADAAEKMKQKLEAAQSKQEQAQQEQK